MKAGLEGGKRAAGLLKQAVEEELRSSPPALAHHIQVVIRVYANMKGLAKTYKDAEILPQLASLDEFVRGFNMGDPMCDYIDAGNGKECSDEKIKGTQYIAQSSHANTHLSKAMFRHDLADMHCQQILFGGSADNGYARLLGPYNEDDAVRSRITLLEGPPFARELAAIKDRYHTASFDKVFRSQMLVITPRRATVSLPTPPRTPSADYAMAAAQVPTGPSSSSSSRAHNPAVTKQPTTAATVLLNKSGERVDSPLSYTSKDFLAIKGRRLCNQFYLLGKCSYLEKFGNCQHQHSAKLSNKQLVALRAVARLTLCQDGKACRESECICGHQ